MNDMLKPRPMKEGEVFGFKDVAGEEFIGRVISLNDTEVVVQWPSHYSNAGDGTWRVGSAFRVALNGTIIIQRCNIIAFHRVMDSLVEVYEHSIAAQKISRKP